MLNAFKVQREIAIRYTKLLEFTGILKTKDCLNWKDQEEHESQISPFKYM